MDVTRAARPPLCALESASGPPVPVASAVLSSKIVARPAQCRTDTKKQPASERTKSSKNANGTVSYDCACMRCAHESSCYLCSTGWLASWLRFDAAESWDGLISSRTECSCGMMRRAAGAVARRIETAMCTHAISSVRQHFASHQGPYVLKENSGTLRHVVGRASRIQPKRRAWELDERRPT